MPITAHVHKSMLLRGVKLPTAALDRSDIEILRSKSQRSGRSYGGVPLGRSNHNGDRRGPINYDYGPGRPHQRQDQPDRAPNFRSNGYQQRNSYPVPGPSSTTWSPPPPPGYPGFGVGLPPPPPPAHLYGNGSYEQNYGRNQGYGGRYPPPPPPPAVNYPAGQHGHQGGQGYDDRRHRPYGNDRGRGPPGY